MGAGGPTRIPRRSGGLRFSLFLLILIAAAWAACSADGIRGADEAAVSLSGRPWPEADRLFRQDPRWLGADDAHSVDLGRGRILWLFGDTLVSPEGRGGRRRAGMIRNSIGIQTGYDPESAAMAFYWKQAGQTTPASFFPESGTTWYWPGDGIRIGTRLLVFLTAIQNAPNPLGFALVGWEAVMIDNPDDAPDRWRIVAVEREPVRFSVVAGTGGVLIHGGFVYAYGCDGTGRRAYLVRWPQKKAVDANLRDPQWWCGEKAGWLTEQRMQSAPAVLFDDAQSEFGVYHDSHLKRYVQIQTIGFGGADLGFRTARFPQGPWGPLKRFYQPQEKRIPGVLIYAAKPHAFLTGADLVITYATNHIDPDRLNADPALYYPRVVRGAFKKADLSE